MAPAKKLNYVGEGVDGSGTQADFGPAVHPDPTVASVRAPVAFLHCHDTSCSAYSDEEEDVTGGGGWPW